MPSKKTDETKVSSPEELLARAIERARKAGLIVSATSSHLDDDGVSQDRNY